MNPEIEIEIKNETPASPLEPDDAEVIKGLREKGIVKDRAPPPEDADTVPEKPVAKPGEKAPAKPAEDKEPIEAKKAAPKVSSEILAQARIRRHHEAEMRNQRAELAAERAKFEEERRTSRAAVEDPKKLRERAIRDPVGFYKELGAPLDDVINVLAASELGKEVPSHLRPLQRQMAQKAEQDERLSAQEKELKGLREWRDGYVAQQQGAQIVAEERGKISRFLTAVPEEFKLVSKQARNDPQEALETLWDLTLRYAEQYPEDPVPSPEEVAQLYEDHLEKYRRLYQDDDEPPTPVNGAADKTPKPEPKKQRTPEVAARTAKDELPEDDEKLNAVIAGRLRRGDHLPKRQG